MTWVTFEDFENGAGAWTEFSNNGLYTETTPEYDGDYSAYFESDGSTHVGAEYIPDAFAGGHQIDQFEFYYYENSNSVGMSLSLWDSSGNEIVEVGTDNPQFQWIVHNGSTTSSLNSPDDINYTKWIRVTLSFDWGASEMSVEFSSGRYTRSATAELNHSDVEKITVGNPTWFGNGSRFWWFDSIRADGAIDIPGAPSSVGATVVGNEQIDLTISHSDWGNEVGHYDVQVSVDGEGFAQITEIDGSNATYTHSVDPAANTFEYRVRAVNRVGASAWTYSSTITTDPTNLAITGTTDTSLSLAWDGVSQADGYDVLLAEASGSSEGDYSVGESVDGSTTTATLSGLENGERYYARVIARYSGGADSLLTNEVATTLPLPGPPISLDTTTEGEITVVWSKMDNSTDGVWNLYRSTDGSKGTQLQSWSDLSVSEFTDTGLDDGERYWYTIERETDHATAGIQSDGTTILPAPTGLTVDGVREREVDLSWSATHNNGDTLVQTKPADTSSWTNQQTLNRTTEVTTVTGLRNGEQYDARVVANTEHTQTEDA